MAINMKEFICIIMSIIMLLLNLVGIDMNKKSEQPIMAQIYVSAQGNDMGSGEKDDPFLTVERAQQEVRKINKEMTGDIIVHIADGVYKLSTPLVFDERDSASGGFTIRYAADEGAKPVLSGGREISGFTLADAEKNIYAAKVDKGFTFRQLYVNGEKAVRARSNTDYSTRIIGASRFDADGHLIPENLNYSGDDALVKAEYGEIYLNADEFTDFDNLQKVELHVLTAWVENILRIKTAETDGNRVVIRVQDNENDLIFNRLHPNIDGYSHKSTHDFVYYIENAGHRSRA